MNTKGLPLETSNIRWSEQNYRVSSKLDCRMTVPSSRSQSSSPSHFSSQHSSSEPLDDDSDWFSSNAYSEIRNGVFRTKRNLFE